VPPEASQGQAQTSDNVVQPQQVRDDTDSAFADGYDIHSAILIFQVNFGMGKN
jgi:hypothetical protein